LHALRSRNAACKSAIFAANRTALDRLDGTHAPALQANTGTDYVAIDTHRASTANAVLTTDMRAGQFEVRGEIRLFSRGNTSASTRSPLTLSEIDMAVVTPAPARRSDESRRTRNVPTRPSPDAGAWQVLPADPPADEFFTQCGKRLRKYRGVTAASQHAGGLGQQRTIAMAKNPSEDRQTAHPRRLRGRPTIA
jgi:hypothetical protein